MIVLMFLMIAMVGYVAPMPIVMRHRWIKQQTALRRGETAGRWEIAGQACTHDRTAHRHSGGGEHLTGSRHKGHTELCNLSYTSLRSVGRRCDCFYGVTRWVFRNEQGHTRATLAALMWPAVAVAMVGMFAYNVTVLPVFRLSTSVAGVPARSLRDFIHPEVAIPDKQRIAELEAELPDPLDELETLEVPESRASLRTQLLSKSRNRIKNLVG